MTEHQLQYQREYQRRWRAANKEKTKAHGRRHYERNRAKAIATAVEWRANNYERWLSNARIRKARRLGLSLEEYNALDFNGPCEICGEVKRRLHMDHDHETGRFRGLLCKGCNTAIARLGDSAERLHRAVVYLNARADKGTN